MPKQADKALTVKVLEQRPSKNRFQAETTGEIQQTRVQLEAILAEIVDKNQKIALLLKLKSKEWTHLRKQLASVFKKALEPQAQRALVKTTMELQNHLHHVERELGADRMKIKTLYHRAKEINILLRKNLTKQK